MTGMRMPADLSGPALLAWTRRINIDAVARMREAERRAELSAAAEERRWKAFIACLVLVRMQADERAAEKIYELQKRLDALTPPSIAA